MDTWQSPQAHDPGWPYAARRGRSKAYGLIHVPNGESTTVHTVTCEWAHGPRPGRWFDAAHSCQNDLCYWPEHLSWKSRRENNADRYRAGTVSRIDADLAARIAISASEPGRPLAAVMREFGVSRKTVQLILAGGHWTQRSPFDPPPSQQVCPTCGQHVPRPREGT